MQPGSKTAERCQTQGYSQMNGYNDSLCQQRYLPPRPTSTPSTQAPEIGFSRGGSPESPAATPEPYRRHCGSPSVYGKAGPGSHRFNPGATVPGQKARPSTAPSYKVHGARAASLSVPAAAARAAGATATATAAEGGEGGRLWSSETLAYGAGAPCRPARPLSGRSPWGHRPSSANINRRDTQKRPGTAPSRSKAISDRGGGGSMREGLPVGCLAGCLNPSRGLHHQNCPNGRSAVASLSTRPRADEASEVTHFPSWWNPSVLQGGSFIGETQCDAEAARVACGEAARRPLLAGLLAPSSYDQTSRALPPGSTSAANEPEGTIARYLQLLKTKAWSPELYLQAREQVMIAGRFDLLPKLSRAVRETTDKAFDNSEFYLPGEGLMWQQERRVSLTGTAFAIPEHKWFGCENLPIDESGNGLPFAFRAKRIQISEANPLDIILELRRKAGFKGPIVLVAEVSKFSADGDIDVDGGGSGLGIFPEDLPGRTNFAHFAKHLCTEARRCKFEATVQDHLTSASNPYLIRLVRVTLLRGPPEEGYPFLEEPVQFTVLLTANSVARPQVKSIKFRRRPPMEWYGDSADNNSLIERLSLMGELARQETYLLREAEQRSDCPAAALTADDWTEEQPVLIFGLPGSSEAARFPRDAVANAVKHWRRESAQHFQQIYLCCRGRGGGDERMASHAAAVVNRNPDAEFLAQALGEEDARAKEQIQEAVGNQVRASVLVPRVAMDQVNRLGERAQNRDILAMKQGFGGQDSDDEDTDDLSSSGVSELYTTGDQVNWDMIGRKTIRSEPSYKLPLAVRQGGQVLDDKVVNTGGGAFYQERVQADLLQKKEEMDDAIFDAVNRGKQARDLLDRRAARVEEQTRKQEGLLHAAEAVLERQQLEDQAGRLGQSEEKEEHKEMTRRQSAPSFGQRLSGIGGAPSGGQRLRSKSCDMLEPIAVPYVDWDVFLEEKARHLARWQARLRILQRSRQRGLACDMLRAAVQLGRWTNLSDVLGSSAITLRVARDIRSETKETAEQKQMKELRDWFYVNSRHRLKVEAELRDAMRRGTVGGLLDDASEDECQEMPTSPTSRASVSTFARRASKQIGNIVGETVAPAAASIIRSLGEDRMLGTSSDAKSRPSAISLDYPQGDGSSPSSPSMSLTNASSRRRASRSPSAVVPGVASQFERSAQRDDAARRRSMHLASAATKLGVMGSTGAALSQSKGGDTIRQTLRGPASLATTSRRTVGFAEVMVEEKQEDRRSSFGSSISSLQSAIAAPPPPARPAAARPSKSDGSARFSVRRSILGGARGGGGRKSVLEAAQIRSGRLPAFGEDTDALDEEMEDLEDDIQDVASILRANLEARAQHQKHEVGTGVARSRKSEFEL